MGQGTGRNMRPRRLGLRGAFAIASVALPVVLSACFFTLEDVVPPVSDAGAYEAASFDSSVPDTNLPPPYDANTIRPDATQGFDAGNSCGALLASDPLNCGTCGHSCITGTCTSSLCAPTVLANETGLRGLAVDAQYVYYSSARGLIRLTKTGGTGVVVTNTAAPNAALAVDATYLFAAESSAVSGNPSVMRASRLGTSQVPALLSNLQGDPSSIALDSLRVYWSSGATLFAAPKDGSLDGGSQTLTGATVGNPIVSLASDGTSLYWTAGARVSSCNLPTCASNVILASGVQPFGLTTFNGNAYFTDVGNGTVQYCATSGCGGGQIQLAGAQQTPYGIAADSVGVYWTNRGNNMVMTCDLPGCAKGPRAIARTGANPGAIVLDASYVYWINSDPTLSGSTGTLMRVVR